jgi:hypothetical protein
MRRFSFAILALGVTLAASGVASAQAYPPYAYGPGYQAYYGYYPTYSAPVAPGYYYPGYPYPYDGTHSGGGAGQTYMNGPKPN